ncbi:MAG: hypothetical protein ACREX8_20330, partial [Gammaproteobacteria bacterium]
IVTFLIQQAGLKRTEAHTGAVTLIQRFGSAANRTHRNAASASDARRSGSRHTVAHRSTHSFRRLGVEVVGFLLDIEPVDAGRGLGDPAQP